MQNFDLSSHIGRLQDIADVLEQQWGETSQHWKDANSRSFQEEHLRPFFVELANAMSVMQRMSDLTRQAQRECVPDRENDYV